VSVIGGEYLQSIERIRQEAEPLLTYGPAPTTTEASRLIIRYLDAAGYQFPRRCGLTRLALMLLLRCIQADKTAIGLSLRKGQGGRRTVQESYGPFESHEKAEQPDRLTPA